MLQRFISLQEWKKREVGVVKRVTSQSIFIYTSLRPQLMILLDQLGRQEILKTHNLLNVARFDESDDLSSHVTPCHSERSFIHTGQWWMNLRVMLLVTVFLCG